MPQAWYLASSSTDLTSRSLCIVSAPTPTRRQRVGVTLFCKLTVKFKFDSNPRGRESGPFSRARWEGESASSPGLIHTCVGGRAGKKQTGTPSSLHSGTAISTIPSWPVLTGPSWNGGASRHPSRGGDAVPEARRGAEMPPNSHTRGNITACFPPPPPAPLGNRALPCPPAGPPPLLPPKVPKGSASELW